MNDDPGQARTLRELLEGTGMTVQGPDAVGVTAIVNDSTKAIPGSLFIAIKGIAKDGHDFLPQAVARGATSLVVEDETRIPPGFAGAVVAVSSGRDALNRLSGRFFGDPGRSLFCVGVTGTDGKTSVTHMVEAVLAAGGLPTGVIGTVDHHFAGHRWPGDTTPPPLGLQERLASFLGLGARAVAMEATSQGLSQSRVSGVPFDVAVFTNLTRDHLDYHRTLDAYFEAKERLFTEALAASPKSPRHAILNIDIPHGARARAPLLAMRPQAAPNPGAPSSYGARIRVPSGAKKWTYGRLGTGADFEVETLATSLSRSVFRFRAWGEEAELALPMLGEFNGANALAAVAVGMAAGLDFQACVEALRHFAGVPGRVQRVLHPGKRMVFIDYAHSPDAFEKVLSTARDAMRRERGDARLVTVFGCGGDRDRGKRPLMLEAALRLSDRVIVTSDNPRSEDPGAIVEEMFTGVRSPADRQRVTVELDRTKAIHLALDSAADRDVVMILGKGHEDYQIIGEKRLFYSDHAVVAAKLGAASGD